MHYQSKIQISHNTNDSSSYPTHSPKSRIRAKRFSRQIVPECQINIDNDNQNNQNNQNNRKKKRKFKDQFLYCALNFGIKIWFCSCF